MRLSRIEFVSYNLLYSYLNSLMHVQTTPVRMINQPKAGRNTVYLIGQKILIALSNHISYSLAIIFYETP